MLGLDISFYARKVADDEVFLKRKQHYEKVESDSDDERMPTHDKD